MKRALISLLAVVAVTATGCGGDDTDKDSDPGASSNAGTDTGGDTGGDTSGDTGGDEPAALPTFCDLITADQVTEAVGVSVTVEVGPFDACEFDDASNVRGLSGSLGTAEVGTANGDFEGYRTGASAALDNGVDHPLEGLGEEAFVATGTFAGGENIQAGGGVLVGNGVVYTVNLAQGIGMTEDELVAISEKLLQLMLDAAA